MISYNIKNNGKAEINMELYNLVGEVPSEYLKTIEGGRNKGKTSIDPMWRLETVIKFFGTCGIGWYTETVEEKIVENPANQEKAIFKRINFYFKYKDENGEYVWSKKVEGCGGEIIISKERDNYSKDKNNPFKWYLDDESFKKADTDAFGSALKKLGFGNLVYKNKLKFSDDKYTSGRNKKGSNGSSGSNESNGSTDKKKVAIINYLMNKHKGNKELCLNELEKLTEFKNQDGKIVKGKRSTSEMSDKAIDFLFNKLKLKI